MNRLVVATLCAGVVVVAAYPVFDLSAQAPGSTPANTDLIMTGMRSLKRPR